MSRRADIQKREVALPPAAVLLVDDNFDDQLFFQLAWEKMTPAPPLRIVGSKAEAIDFLNGQGKFADRGLYPFPSLIILDMRLQDGNGCDLVRWIRAHSRFNSLRLIIMSGSAEEREVNRAYASGVDSFLTKPGDPRDLRQAIDLILSCWHCSAGQNHVSP